MSPFLSSLSPRDLAILRLLDATPLTAAQIRKVSVTFDGGPFRDGRRVRERMQTLKAAGFIRDWSSAIPGGGLMAYYRLTVEGHRVAFPESTESPPRSSFAESFARCARLGYQAVAPPSAPTERGTEPSVVRWASPPREIHAHRSGRFSKAATHSFDLPESTRQKWPSVVS